MHGFRFDLFFVVVIVLGVSMRLLLKIDWTPGRYKIMFHEGAEVGIKTKMSPGRLVIEGGEIKINGPKELTLPLTSLRAVELFRLHGLGRMIRITHEQGTLFVSVVRFCIAGQFASVDFFKTGKLVTLLNASLPSRSQA